MIIEKRQKVKKRKRHIKKKVSEILPGFHILALLILVFLCRYLFILGTKWDYFKVKEIKIEGNSRITPDQIKMWTGINEGLNILTFDLAYVPKIAEAQPWIKSLVIERKFPCTLFIQIEENLPVAIWEDNGKYFLMDEFGFLLEGIDSIDSFKTLPILTCSKKLDSQISQRCSFPYWSNGLTIIENIKEIIPDMMNELIKIIISNEDQAIIFLSNDRKILLNMSTYRSKFLLLKGLREKVPDQWQSMGYCDLRFDNKIIFG